MLLRGEYYIILGLARDKRSSLNSSNASDKGNTFFYSDTKVSIEVSGRYIENMLTGDTHEVHCKKITIKTEGFLCCWSGSALEKIECWKCDRPGSAYFQVKAYLH